MPYTPENTAPTDLEARVRTGDIERGFGAVPIDAINQKLAETDTEFARLKALHGPANKYEDQRKIVLAMQRILVRSKFADENKKFTVDVVDDEARASLVYKNYVDEGIIEAAEYEDMNSQRNHLNELLRRGDALIRSARGSV